jgi:hypothetical protein
VRLFPELQGYFTANYAPLRGSDWLRRLPDWERQAFSRIGRTYALYGHLGGVARAHTALRDTKGRFISTSNKE